MLMARIGFSCVGAIALMAGTAPASADVLSPVAAFSVHDEPIDGLGDSFNALMLIRTQSYRADRAMLEYDISAYEGMTVVSAIFTGSIANNNSGGTWPRIFDFGVYDGNGVADRHDAHPGQLAEQPDVKTTLAAKADHGHAKIIVGPQHTGVRRQGQCSAGGQRALLDERTAVDSLHDGFLSHYLGVFGKAPSGRASAASRA